jgi:hypothetical protein
MTLGTSRLCVETISRTSSVQRELHTDGRSRSSMKARMPPRPAANQFGAPDGARYWQPQVRLGTPPASLRVVESAVVPLLRPGVGSAVPPRKRVAGGLRTGSACLSSSRLSLDAITLARVWRGFVQVGVVRPARIASTTASHEKSVTWSSVRCGLFRRSAAECASLSATRDVLVPFRSKLP